MPKILGELKDASLENLASDPVANTQGRVWNNTTEGRTKLDSGLLKRAFLLNDQKLVVGNSGTAADNVRFNRAAASVLQFLQASSVTPEGTLASTALAQLSSRLESYLDASKPVVGNPGRLIFVTDLNEVQFDNGATWQSVVGASGGWGALGATYINSATVLTSGNAKRIYQADTSVGSFNLELPAPTAGFLLTVTDFLGTFDTNPLTITRSGPGVQIQGLASDYVLRTAFGSWGIFCDGTNYYFA